MVTLLVWLVILGVPTAALIFGGLHLQGRGYQGWRRYLALAMLALGGLLAVSPPSPCLAWRPRPPDQSSIAQPHAVARSTARGLASEPPRNATSVC